jgi:hypothetical protein
VHLCKMKNIYTGKHNIETRPQILIQLLIQGLYFSIIIPLPHQDRPMGTIMSSSSSWSTKPTHHPQHARLPVVSIAKPNLHQDRIRNSTRAFQHTSMDGHQTPHTSWADARNALAQRSQNEYDVVLAQRQAQVQQWLDEVKIVDDE